MVTANVGFTIDTFVISITWQVWYVAMYDYTCTGVKILYILYAHGYAYVHVGLR